MREAEALPILASEHHNATWWVDETHTTPDERRALLCLSILDHRLAVRDRYTGAARDAFVAEAVAQARAALDGATITEIALRDPTNNCHSGDGASREEER